MKNLSDDAAGNDAYDGQSDDDAPKYDDDARGHDDAPRIPTILERYVKCFRHIKIY